jgi:hypothetical protein
VFIDAVVLVEALVLRGNEGIPHMLGDVLKLDPYAALVPFENLGERPALTVQDNARTGKPVIAKLGVIRQVCSRLIVEVDNRTEIDSGLIDPLVLAELLVASLQVGKIDATQHLGTLDRLRILHCRCDQVIDIDVLELKCLEHMGTARIQDLSDLRARAAGRIPS